MKNTSAGTDIAGHIHTPTAFWVSLLASPHSQQRPTYHLALEPDTSFTCFYHNLLRRSRWCPARPRPGQTWVWFPHKLFISSFCQQTTYLFFFHSVYLQCFLFFLYFLYFASNILNVLYFLNIAFDNTYCKIMLHYNKHDYNLISNLMFLKQYWNV